MNHHYSDIRSLIYVPPKWWDEHAVPRYCDFSPDNLANIYAEECCLLLICCQQCGTEFKVAMSIDPMEKYANIDKSKPDQIPFMETYDWLAEEIRSNEIHYGDPPNIDCCGAGPTMNSVPKRVIEYWRKSIENWSWQRDSSLEVEINHEIEQE